MWYLRMRQPLNTMTFRATGRVHNMVADRRMFHRSHFGEKWLQENLAADLCGTELAPDYSKSLQIRSARIVEPILVSRQPRYVHK
jgi:hypothetical protein